VHDKRVGEGPALEAKDAEDGLDVQGVGAEAVDGLCEKAWGIGGEREIERMKEKANVRERRAILELV
jgi:hypothetical protein